MCTLIDIQVILYDVIKLTRKRIIIIMYNKIAAVILEVREEFIIPQVLE